MVWLPAFKYETLHNHEKVVRFIGLYPRIGFSNSVVFARGGGNQTLLSRICVIFSTENRPER